MLGLDFLQGHSGDDHAGESGNDGGFLGTAMSLGGGIAKKAAKSWLKRALMPVLLAALPVILYIVGAVLIIIIVNHFISNPFLLLDIIT